MNRQDKTIILLEAIERHLDLANLLYSNKIFKMLKSIDAKLDDVNIKLNNPNVITKSRISENEYPYIFPGDREVDFGGGHKKI